MALLCLRSCCKINLSRFLLVLLQNSVTFRISRFADPTVVPQALILQRQIFKNGWWKTHRNGILAKFKFKFKSKSFFLLIFCSTDLCQDRKSFVKTLKRSTLAILNEWVSFNSSSTYASFSNWSVMSSAVSSVQYTYYNSMLLANLRKVDFFLLPRGWFISSHLNQMKIQIVGRKTIFSFFVSQ